MLLFLFPNNKAAKKEEHAHLRQLYQNAKEKSAEFCLLVGREGDEKKWNDQFVGFNRRYSTPLIVEKVFDLSP